MQGLPFDVGTMTKPRFTLLSQAVEAYYEELREFVRGRTGSTSMAEDVVQETWTRASTTTAALPDNPRAYLYRMAGNVAVDHVRRQQAWEKAQGRLDGEQEQDFCPAMEHVPGTAPDPVEAVISRKELAALSAAVYELPEKCREVFLLYRGHGLSMREVATRLSISEKTVEKHIARAMVHCRARLKEAGRLV